jgi:hypothetical protein
MQWREFLPDCFGPGRDMVMIPVHPFHTDSIDRITSQPDLPGDDGHLELERDLRLLIRPLSCHHDRIHASSSFSRLMRLSIFFILPCCVKIHTIEEEEYEIPMILQLFFGETTRQACQPLCG